MIFFTSRQLYNHFLMTVKQYYVISEFQYQAPLSFVEDPDYFGGEGLGVRSNGMIK
jgi:hypothetical protein